MKSRNGRDSFFVFVFICCYLQSLQSTLSCIQMHERCYTNEGIIIIIISFAYTRTLFFPYSATVNDCAIEFPKASLMVVCAGLTLSLLTEGSAWATPQMS